MLPNLTIHATTYVGVVHDKPLLMEINYGVTDPAQPPQNGFETIINSLTFGPRTQAYSSQAAQRIAELEDSRGLLDKLLMTGVAHAADAAPTASASEKNSALYSPAVVKVYNAYCMDINLDGAPYLRNVCQALTGSAFFVSGDGYLGTNGHVATSSPKDIVISDAIIQLAQGDETYFAALANMVHTKPSDPEYAGKTGKEILAMVIDKMYSKIDDSHFTMTNNVSNLLVDLNQNQPDINELIKDTKARKSYPDQDAIKHAKIVGADFRAIDGLPATGFKASDVAIIKIEGSSNFPIVKLGAISNVTQGSSLSILGFPAQASDNSIVDDKQSKVTLTSGKVSSIKNAQGSQHKLIETDTTIGHGDRGGPALDDGGSVVGIATYTADGSGSGSGVFNYIRDIQDLKDLISKSSVNLTTTNKTQTEWQKGIDLYYRAHYSQALKSFNAVKQSYPQHPTVADFIGSAQEHIKNGQDVKDFPMLLVAGAGATVLVIGAGALFMILRHKKVHNIYQTQVASGNAQPVVPGTSPQYITYDPSQMTVLGRPTGGVQGTTQPGVTSQQTIPSPQPTTLQQPPTSPSLTGVITPNQPTVVVPGQSDPPADSTRL